MSRYEKINSFERRFHPALTIISFSVPYLLFRSLSGFITSYLFFFFELYTGLSYSTVIMIVVGTGLVNVFIQPLLGYLSDRNYALTRKAGRRFPWIVIAGVIAPILVILLFSSQLIAWMNIGLFFMLFLLYNVASSIYSLNYSASLLAKFRHPKERLILATIIEFFGVLLYLISSLFILLFPSYFFGAVIISIAFIVMVLLGIPGLLEERQLIDTYYGPNLTPQESFFKDFFRRFAIFSRKNFIVLVIQWAALAAFNVFFVTRMIFYVHYVLSVTLSMANLFAIIYFIMMIVAIPHGFLISWFAGHVKTWIISGFILGASVLSFFFIDEFLIALLIIAVVGFAVGLGTVALIPLTGDVFDEHALHRKQRAEGFNYGLLALFGTGMTMFMPIFLSTPFILLFLAMFSIYPPIPSPMFVLGIKITFSLVPSIIMLIATILFVVFYDLKPQKTGEVREELKTLQI
jgi:Na+/melibiose symporter-like transporter